MNSLRRYSTHRFEKLCSRPPSASAETLSSADLPLLKALVALDRALLLELPILTFGLLFPACAEPDAALLPKRCKPALSRSSSDQERMEASNESISNRLLSARGVLKNDIRTLVTSRRSTLFSPESFFRRRRASVRCSFSITAKDHSRRVRKAIRWAERHSTHLHAAACLYVSSSP